MSAQFDKLLPWLVKGDIRFIMLTCMEMTPTFHSANDAGCFGSTATPERRIIQQLMAAIMNGDTVLKWAGFQRAVFKKENL